MNPVSLHVHERLGADTVNVPSDLSLGQLAEQRQASAVPLDFYVESPDNVGGFVRQYEICEIVRVASPVYLKWTPQRTRRLPLGRPPRPCRDRLLP